MVPRNVVAMMTSFSGEPGSVRTETFDLDLRRRNGQFLPVRLYHRIAFGQDGSMGASRTLVLNRSPGLDVDEGQRAAEVRFARFFNNTPIAIATVNRQGRILQANAPFTRLFGTLPRTGEGGEGPLIAEAFRDGESAQVTAALKSAGESFSDIPPLELHTAGEKGGSVRVWVTPVSDNAGGWRVGDPLRPRHHGFPQGRGTARAIAEDERGGPARGRRGARFQQRAAGDHRLQRSSARQPPARPIRPSRTSCRSSRTPTGPRAWCASFSPSRAARPCGPEVLNLNDRLYELSMLLKRLLGERVELDLSHGRDLWFVKADVNQFEQVVVNLAVNARDAMPDGGKLVIRTGNVPASEAARLHVSGMPAADYVVVEVSDTGTGMDAGVLEKIFEPFFTTKEMGKGTGLGLSTVFGIVKQSGGFIDVDSQVGRGTIFRIYMPRHIPDANELPEEIKPETSRNRPPT